VTGVEISAEFRGRELHLLGYFFLGGPALAGRLSSASSRNARSAFWEMVARLMHCGVALADRDLRPYARVEALAGGTWRAGGGIHSDKNGTKPRPFFFFLPPRPTRGFFFFSQTAMTVRGDGGGNTTVRGRDSRPAAGPLHRHPDTTPPPPNRSPKRRETYSSTATGHSVATAFHALLLARRRATPNASIPRVARAQGYGLPVARGHCPLIRRRHTGALRRGWRTFL